MGPLALNKRNILWVTPSSSYPSSFSSLFSPFSLSPSLPPPFPFLAALKVKKIAQGPPRVLVAGPLLAFSITLFSLGRAWGSGCVSSCHRPSLPGWEHHRLMFSLVFIFKQVAVPDKCLQLLWVLLLPVCNQWGWSQSRDHPELEEVLCQPFFRLALQTHEGSRPNRERHLRHLPTTVNHVWWWCPMTLTCVAPSSAPSC